MPKYIAAIEGWGDITNYIDYLQNKSFEYNPLEIISDTKEPSGSITFGIWWTKS
jgi:hypothetical protein